MAESDGDRAALADQWLGSLVDLIPRTVFAGTSETPETKDKSQPAKKPKAPKTKKKRRASSKRKRPSVENEVTPQNQELRDKLGEKIAALRAQRKADVQKPAKPAKPQKQTKRAKSDDTKTLKEAQRREQSIPSKPGHMQIPSEQSKRMKTDDKSKHEKPSIAFSNLVGFDEPSGPRKRKQSLEVLLEKAERAKEKEKKLLALDAGAGKEVAELARKRKAIQKASGEKVRDDPTLLKKTIKKKEREKRKSDKEWKQRGKETKKKLAERVKKREDNLRARSDAKKAKRESRRRR